MFGPWLPQGCPPVQAERPRAETGLDGCKEGNEEPGWRDRRLQVGAPALHMDETLRSVRVAPTLSAPRTATSAAARLSRCPPGPSRRHADPCDRQE
ncbi:hypothetical protein NDU88_002250 [Pleurodeles waltl]|uniref:Uncharacterized protein n=1 Tax=Pleurodeles waltl TaxID=8319 RepID=A0AAV7SBD3_PLEWA|nr:hypothetical protein NDU88_002250 [Pleurodeles waltl]